MGDYEICQNCSCFIQDSKDLQTDLGICIMDMGIEKEAALSLAPVIVEGKGESPQQYGSER